jgi:hypothetical protein
MALCGELALELPMDLSLDRKGCEWKKLILGHYVPEDKILYFFVIQKRDFHIEKVQFILQFVLNLTP